MSEKCEPLGLDNQLCFSLYVCSKEIIRKYRPLLEPFGLTYTGYITMMALWEKDGVNVKELGERLFLDSGTLTPLLKKLEAKGYIVRRRDDRDERNIVINLTEEGKALKSSVVCVPKQMAGCMDLSSEAAEELAEMLHKMMHCLQECNNASTL